MTFNDYFDMVFVINLERRHDRWKHVCEQFEKFSIGNWKRFNGYDGVVYGGKVEYNGGCTNSHRALLEIIAHNRYERALVLEDDFEIRQDNFHELFEKMIEEVPLDWDMLYLGGHYADKPQKRISRHVIKFNRMLTTSSYAITWRFARKIAPYIFGAGPIDSLYGAFQPDNNCYIFQPRLMIQYENLSDIQGRVMENRTCMEDAAHEAMV